ncbi:MAG TPA: hypothetical protein VHC98_01305 [Candidatus Saccharimonadales bacterium]|nr:hypothetical protein [Candidatus Saccharimonadales bacterium]
MFTLRRIVLAFAVLLLPVGAAGVAVAASATTSGSPVVTAYDAGTAIRQGMIVGLDPHDTTKVIPLTNDRDTAMLGVSIPASDAPLSLTGNGDTAQVYVATSGRYSVLVSNQNGAISVGDYITISALNGVGMKADNSQIIVLGKAAVAFTGAGNTVSTATLQTGSGKQTVAIGSIPVDLNVAGNPNLGHGTGNLPGFLQVAGNSIAAKPVSAPRVWLSLAVLAITALIAGGVLYSGVRGSIISIGRNPLAKQSIVRGLVQIILTSVTILIIGLFAVYLLLRL